MRAAKIAIAALLFTAPILAMDNSGAGGVGNDKPSIELRSEIPEYYNTEYNDTDGDGLYEIFCFGQGFIRGFDPPSYRPVLSLDGITGFPQFKDLGNNGSIEVIVYNKAPGYFNCSVFSGDDFGELWRGPDINGTLAFNTVKDADGDTENEFIWIADRGHSAQNASSVLIWGWENRTLEWESLPILNDTGVYDSCTIKNIDSDPAPEIILDVQDQRQRIYHTESLLVYDGLTHQLQWKVVSDGSTHYMAYRDFIKDLDNDSRMEVMLDYRVTNETGFNTSGFLILSGETGAVIWNVTTVGNFTYPGLYDLDGDGGTDVLISGRDGDYARPYNATYEVFDIRERQRVWVLGPNQQDGMTYGEMTANDIDGDGRSEIIFSNDTSAGTEDVYWFHKYQILDGQNFSVLWSSPDSEGRAQLLDTASFCDTERPVIILSSFSQEGWTFSNGSISIISTDDFRELWRSPTYPGKAETWVEDYVNDSRKELLLWFQYPGANTEQAILIDTRTFTQLWASPQADEFFPYFSLTGIDIAGDPGVELVFINESIGMIYSGNGVTSVTNRTIMLFNGTTFEQIWRSDMTNDGAEIMTAWDFDNDSNVEVVLNEYHEGWGQWAYYFTIWEFPRMDIAEPGMYSDPPSIVLKTPVNGDVLHGLVNVSGTAIDDIRVTSVGIRVDEGPWNPAALRLSAGDRFCDWNMSWNTSAVSNGTHRISARAFDGQHLSPEVSINVTIKAPVPDPPRVPRTTVGSVYEALCPALAIIFIAVLAIFLAFRMRK